MGSFIKKSGFPISVLTIFDPNFKIENVMIKKITNSMTLHSISISLLLIFGISCMSFAQEICDNRIDDDNDGLIDCYDPDCEENVSCWDCLTEFYQVHSNSTIVSLDPANGTYTTLATITGASGVNGAQYNPVDGHVYAPSIINGEHRLGMIHRDGTVVDLNLSLPGNNIFYAGAIDANGTMYIGKGGTNMHSIDLGDPSLSVEDTGAPFPGAADLALDLNTGLFYGIKGNAKLTVLDPFLNTVSNYDLAGTINNESGAFGATWSCNDGSFFAYNNSSGKIYSVNTQTLTATEVQNGTGNLSINDGFNCVNAPPPFESNCGDGIDQDGDGLIDCEDPDCYNSNQCLVEICDNGIDDDLDGWIDCSDTECFALNICLEVCDNGVDDNGNGLIDDADPQCNTPSGVSGGLESNRRLSDKIALRNFYKTINKDEQYQEKLNGIIPFHPPNERQEFTIASVIPTDVLDAAVTESTPEDLIAITNAVDVIAADYYSNNQRIASILGITSENGVYEHSKYICDRLDGSRLLDISYLFVNGGNFISYELLNKDGQIEYAVSFSAYLDSNAFFIENHWNLYEYPVKETYFNFQVWTKSYESIIVLLESIMEKLADHAPISKIECSDIPRVFINYGKYENGQLKLIITNKNRTDHISLHGMLTRMEGGDLESFTTEIELNKSKQECVYVETGYLYDMGLSMRVKNGPGDELFVADGAWGVDDQNPGALVKNVTISKQDQYFDEDTYQIERSVSVHADVKDYLNIYRTLGPKMGQYNLNPYDQLTFSAFGEGSLEITVVKNSIEDWKEQFRTYITLDDEAREYSLTRDMFTSPLTTGLDLSDVTMVVFTLLGDNIEYAPKSIVLENVRFDKTPLISSSGETPDRANVIVISNPVRSVLTLKFDHALTNNSTIQIFGGIGNPIITSRIPDGFGQQIVSLDVSVLPMGTYFYRLNMDGSKFAAGKFIKVE